MSNHALDFLPSNPTHFRLWWENKDWDKKCLNTVYVCGCYLDKPDCSRWFFLIYFFIYILAFLPLSVSQISIMDYRCEPVAPKWMMMIIMSACHICIIPSCPPEIFPIPTGDLHFLYFSFHEDITLKHVLFTYVVPMYIKMIALLYPQMCYVWWIYLISVCLSILFFCKVLELPYMICTMYVCKQDSNRRYLVVKPGNA